MMLFISSVAKNIASARSQTCTFTLAWHMRRRTIFGHQDSKITVQIMGRVPIWGQAWFIDILKKYTLERKRGKKFLYSLLFSQIHSKTLFKISIF